MGLSYLCRFCVVSASFLGRFNAVSVSLGSATKLLPLVSSNPDKLKPGSAECGTRKQRGNCGKHVRLAGVEWITCTDKQYLYPTRTRTRVGASHDLLDD